MSIAYLDNSATTSVLPEVADKMAQMMCRDYGNPASIHGLGITAERAVTEARRIIAKAVGGTEEEIVFTSGGTESNNLAVLGSALAAKRKGNRIITTEIEHHSVLNACKELESRGFDVVYLPVDSNGVVSLSAFDAALNDKTVLCTCMLVNNETGAIQPIKEMARRIHEGGFDCVMHTDCVQAFGKLSFTVKQLGVDLLTISGHKIHGPKGVGALYIRKGIRVLPQTYGGGQENGLRSGTVASHQIAGMGTAVALMPAVDVAVETAKELRKTVLEGIGGLSDVTVNSPADGSPFIVNLSVEGVPSEVMIRALEQSGVYVSGGSACAKGGRSHVLLAQGLSSRQIDGALRISFSYDTPKEAAERFVTAFLQAHRVLRRKR